MVAYQNARIALEEEAVRVLKLMPKWTPGMQRGKAVRVRYTMPVIYRLQ
jgi:protein TonB